MHAMNGGAENGERWPSVVAPGARLGRWHERFIAALACASESDSRKLKTLFRTGLGMVLFFEVATWFEAARFEHPLLHAEWPFFAFDIALVGAAFCLTYFKRFERNWRVVAMAFCLILIASRAMSALAAGEDEPLLLALFVLALGAAVHVPWSVRWQGGLTLAGLIAFAIAALEGIVEPNHLQRWVVLAATMAFAMSFTALKDHYRSQALLIEELLDKQKTLTKSQAVLRTLFDAVPDMVALTRLGDGKLLEVNDEFLRRIGLSREQALATTTVQACAWARPEDRDKYVQQMKQKGRARKLEFDFRFQGVVAPYLMSSVTVEIDGELLALNVACDVTQIKENERALRQAQERLSAQVEELTAAQTRLRAEVAEREAAERAARERETTLRKVFETSLDSITIRRASDGVYLEVNKEFERLTGYSRQEALGKTSEDLHLRTALGQSAAAFCRNVEVQGQVRNIEANFRTKDGQIVPCLISAGVVEIGGKRCVVSVTRDITRIKENERELIAAREAALAAARAKSEFLSSMSHEIRTPMNAILGMADLLSDGPLGGEQRRYVDIMRSNGNALLHLINDILDVAKIESGRLSLESVSFDLEDLVSKAVETMGVRAQAKGLELTARILPHVPLNLIGDPLRLRQILINLAANAIKFTENGEVALTVESLSPAEALRLGFSAGKAGGENGQPGAPAAWLRFSVADTGIGIAADYLGTIFTDFTQADASIARRFGGSGLGLTIVRRLSELMGGRIEVESEVGRGSTFRVTVALGVDSRPAAAAVRGAAPCLDGVRILIVDDNETNRLILREILVRSRAEVTEADSGAAALAELGRARAAGRPYRLMLLDYRMPGMDGVEVARKAIADGFTRTAAGNHDTIILMLTSDDLNFRLARMRKAGLRTYLIKPINRVELLETIGKLLNRRDAAPPPPPGGWDATSADARPLRILLAEDSPDNRFLIQAYFKKLPYQVELAENGRIAIDKFKASPPDLVLMDVQMPEVDGLAATRVIRQWEAERGLPPTPIVALTASVLEDDVKRSLAAGCDAHVSKPVKKPALLAAIRKAMAMRPAARAALEPPPAAEPESPDEPALAGTSL